MLIPTGYDPTTLYQWLWFKCRCQEGTPTEFQRLFEEVMKRYRPEFMQIRPYGNIGDRKADGLLRADSAIFQVYSPDDLNQAQLVKKINEDLDGAVTEWPDLRNWTFVYNVRRGLPPDIPSILAEKQKQYPDIKIEHLSNDGLWEILRGLTPQQRAEVLGAPIGYEHLFIPPGDRVPPAGSTGRQDDSWLILVQDLLNPIDPAAIVDSLRPSLPFGLPIYLRPKMDSWSDAAAYQRKVVAELLENCRATMPPRFAVYSLAPIPLIAHLGFLLTYSVRTRYFKFHVDTKSWAWPAEHPTSELELSGLPKERVDASCEVAVRVSLSSRIGQHETDEAAPKAAVQIDVFVKNPSLTWLSSESQVAEFAKVFRHVLGTIRDKVPNCTGIHLFLAAAAPIALAAGQEINPRMTPPVSVYEYHRNQSPRYEFAFTLA